MQKLVLSGIFLFLIVFPSYAFADGPYLNIPPTNAFDKIHTDSGTVSASNFSMPVNIIGGTGITVSGNNGTHTVTITNTGSSGSTTKGTYNQTYANNVLVNSLGNRINFLNGTNSTVNVVDDPTRNQVNVTISSTGGSGTSGVSSLNALTGALTIACVAGNTTCTTSGGNTITINTAYNIATLNLNEIFSGITTMNNLKLGGQMNINGQTMQSFGHVYSWQNHTGTVCLTNQTTSCGPAGSATYDTLVNIGTGEASVYAGNTTKTNFDFKTLKQGSHITLTNNTNDVTISATGLLSNALLSINNDTTSAQTLKVIGSGSIADNGGGVHTITTKTYQNNTGGNLGTHGIGPFASMNAQVLQFLSLVSANSNCAFTNNSTNLILTCSTPPSITSVNSQTGPSITITRQPSYTTITNSTNNIKVGIDATGVMELNGTQTVTGTKTHSADLIMSGANINLGTNGLTNSGHKSTLPLTSGILCQTNQTTSCGTNSGVTSITGTAHNVTASSSTGAVTLNTGDNVVVTGGSNQNIAKQLNIVGNKFVIQTTSGTPTVSSTANLYVAINDTNKFFIMDGFNQNPGIILRTALGTMAAPTKTTSGTPLGVIGYGGYQQTTNAFTGQKVRISASATEDWTSTSNGAKLVFETTPNGGTTLTTGLTIDQDQSTIFATRQFWTPITDPVTAFTNAIWKSSTNADVLKYRNNANTTTYNILSTLGAVTTATPADPSGTTSTTAKMMGLAGSITPAVSTRVDMTVCGRMANSLINDGVTVQLRYGTGTAPTNGATLTGTQLGASQTLTEKVAAQADGYCVTGIATGLTIGTAYWMDVAVNAVTAGTASITGNTIKAHEV